MTMNNLNQIELYKSRGYTACISEAFGTFAHNLKTIFLHTWVYAVVMSLLFSLLVSSATTILTDGLTVADSVCLLVSLLLSLCAMIVLFARASMLINGQKAGWNIRRVARIAIITLAFYVLVGIILGLVTVLIAPSGNAAQNSAPVLITSLITNSISLVIWLVVLPFLYVFSKYLIEPDSKLRRLVFRGYKTGFRHWGFIFTTVFLAYLCEAVCAVILALPAVIIMSARLASINGVTTLGDPSGLPAYFDVMQFGLFALATFIWAYISIVILFVYFFMYGSIETREKEKREFLNKQQ